MLDSPTANSSRRSPRKPKGHGGERREEILSAALRLFTEHGVDAVSTRQIADAVGISQPTLYAYFATRAEIGCELHERAFGLLAQRLAAHGGVLAHTPEQFVEGLRIYIDFGLENPEMYRIAFMDVGPKMWISKGPGMSPMAQTTYRVLATAVEDAWRRGLTVDVDPAILTQSAWASMHGLVSLLIAKPGFPWAEREPLIRNHLRGVARSVLDI